jgi:hypothetical protein
MCRDGGGFGVVRFPLPRNSTQLGKREIGGGDVNLVLRMARRIDPASRSGPRFIFKYYLCLGYIIFNGGSCCIEMARSHLRYLSTI